MFTTKSNHVKHILAKPTSHGVGSKRVLLDALSNNAGITQIAHTTILPGEKIEAHVHQDLEEFFYLLEGELEFFLDEINYHLTADSFIFVKNRVSHSIKNTSLKECKMITFSVVVK